jgi:hypothetical protein
LHAGSAGADVKAVRRMGHASASITLDVYADLFDEDLDGVATALDQMARKSDGANMLPKPENGPSGALKQEGPVPFIFKGTGQL